MTRKRWLFIAAAAAFVIGVIVYGFMPRPVPVETAAAKRAPMSVWVEEEGKARVKDRFVVSAPVPGYVRRITLDVGDAVEAGQKIAIIEPLRAAEPDPRSRAASEAAIAAAEAAMGAAVERFQAAKADAEYAAANSARARSLFSLGYISKDEAERAKTAADSAEATRFALEASVRAARAELDRARTAIGYSGAPATGTARTIPVHAPRGGRVLTLHRESEGVVNPGDPLIDIGDTALLEVKAEVLSDDAVKIRPGMAVSIERWGGDAPISGTVRTIEPSAFTKISSLGVEEQRVLVIADITSPTEEWQRLGDGYRVDARFIIWQEKDVLQVPAGALFRRGGSWALFEVEGGRARERTVEIGQRNGLSAQVISGVSEGDMVVLNPSDALSDGVRVKLAGSR